MKTNCDIGERGVAHPIDDQLIRYIDIANIACGGHAGSIESIDYYRGLAEQNHVMLTAHLSYPDRENFGRNKMVISLTDLLCSLSEQYRRLPVGKIKFHGALYHEANNDLELAPALLKWMQQHSINTVLAPHDSLIAIEAEKCGLTVLGEGFIERGYCLRDGRFQLISRGQPGAELTSVSSALEQYHQIASGKLIIAKREYPFSAQTVCIHSDSTIALELVHALSELQA
jgi:UPF0271 protein